MAQRQKPTPEQDRSVTIILLPDAYWRTVGFCSRFYTWFLVGWCSASRSFTQLPRGDVYRRRRGADNDCRGPSVTTPAA